MNTKKYRLILISACLAFCQNLRAIEKKEIRGLYLNLYSTKGKRFNDAMKIVKNTDLNAFVIDIKNVRGSLLFKSKVAQQFVPEAIEKVFYKDLSVLVNKVKKHNIYTIARIAIFKDNFYVNRYPHSSIKRSNNKHFMKKDGIKWVDPHYKEYWKYVLALAKECYAAGFDEVQFDYIRFPGSRAPLVFPHGPNNGKINRSELITKFARYLKKNLSDLNKPTSFDVFGLVGNLHNNDLGIGQEWHKLSPYTNYMSPMMYPSHYPNGFAGIRTPDLRPYSIIAQSVARSIRANNNSKKPTNIRPWIQAFTAKWLKHHIPYGKNELNQQIKALKDKGIKSYLLWHPGSKFNLFYREVFNQKKKIVKENLEAEDLEANPEEEDILSSHN